MSFRFKRLLLQNSFLILTLVSGMVCETDKKKKERCGLMLPSVCKCEMHSNISVNIFCEKNGLTQIPGIDVGLNEVHIYSLQDNNLKSVQTGDFFGIKVSHLVLKNNKITDLNLLAFWGLEYSLDNLDISDNHMINVPTDALRLLRNLKTLNLAGNKISNLSMNDFGSMKRLEVLTLDRNPIAFIHPDSFSGTELLLLSLRGINFTGGLNIIPTKHLEHLRGLSVGLNKLTEIPDKFFTHFQSLKRLNFDRNKLSTLRANVFGSAENSLKNLEMNWNRIRKIPKHTLRKIRYLETLELTHNKIRKIHARSFNSSKNLLSLDLRYNMITEINRLAFVGLDNIQSIDIRGNRLITFEEDVFFWPNSKVKNIYLSENPWLCNCLFKWLKQDYKRGDPRIDIFTDLESMVCKRPEILNDILLVKVAIEHLTCDHEYYYYYEYYDE